MICIPILERFHGMLAGKGKSPRSSASASVSDSTPASAGPAGLHAALLDPAVIIDTQTHNDIDLEAVERAFGKTHTSFGSELFHHWLHSVKPAEELAEIQEEIRRLAAAPEERRYMAKRLGRIGKQRRGNIIPDLWNGLHYRPKIVEYILPILLANLTVNVLLSFIFTGLIPLFVSIFLAANFIVYLITNRYISGYAGSISYFNKGCFFLLKYRRKYGAGGSSRASAAGSAADFPRVETFRTLFRCSVLFREGVGGPESQDLISLLIDYLRMFLCLEAVAYNLTVRHIDRNIGELRKTILYIGRLDCVLNNVRLVEEEKCCYAAYRRERGISFRGLRHPLVQDCVTEDLEIGKSLVITGMNMSGKSTFMKSLALNQLFATGFGIAFAETYETGIYRIVTSLMIVDDIAGRKSKYYVEAERVVHIKEALERQPVLCLIDEILTGTNTDERIFASIAILDAFCGYSDSIIVAATHDTRIAEELSGKYDARYFDGEIRDERIEFDYKLRPGIVSRRNGLLVLKYLGLDVGLFEKGGKG